VEVFKILLLGLQRIQQTQQVLTRTKLQTSILHQVVSIKIYQIPFRINPKILTVAIIMQGIHFLTIIALPLKIIQIITIDLHLLQTLLLTIALITVLIVITLVVLTKTHSRQTIIIVPQTQIINHSQTLQTFNQIIIMEVVVVIVGVKITAIINKMDSILIVDIIKQIIILTVIVVAIHL